MKLTENDLVDACNYIMHESLLAVYGADYKKHNIYFDIRSVPITVRQIVDLFIEYLRKLKKEREANPENV